MGSPITSAGVIAVLKRFRLDLSSEKATQAGIETAFISSGVPFEREKRLSSADVPDFLVDGRIVVEVKLKGQSKMAVFGQLKRYAEHQPVQAIILVTNLAMGLPPEIEGKPAFIASLGAAWL